MAIRAGSDSTGLSSSVPRCHNGGLTPGRRRAAWIAVLLLAGAAATAGVDALRMASGGDIPTYVPRDASLRGAGLYFYPALATERPRAFIFFLGNDIGFWRAHRQLSADLAREGYAVAGFDMKPMLASLPVPVAARDSVFLTRVTALIARARRELAPQDGIPLILGGHSLGAEVALWIAAHAEIPNMAGVLALSPGSRSHLRVAASDILGTAEPTGPESFSVAAVTALATSAPGNHRVAIVRGQRDDLRFADDGLLAAGGDRARMFLVRFAGHSLKQVSLARFVVRDALGWLLERPVDQAGARPATATAGR